MAAKAPKKTGKAAAAKAERDREERALEWQGLTLKLPATFPEEIVLDLALVRTSDDPSTTFELLKTMVGEDQFRLVRNKMSGDEKVTLADVVELVGEIFEAYGTSEGESEASQGS
jgi:lipase chaperone LimK